MFERKNAEKGYFLNQGCMGAEHTECGKGVKIAKMGGKGYNHTCKLRAESEDNMYINFDFKST